MTDSNASASTALAAAMAPARPARLRLLDRGRPGRLDRRGRRRVDRRRPHRAASAGSSSPSRCPAPTHLEIVAADLMGLCRPRPPASRSSPSTSTADGTGSARTVADLATPQTCLLPRLPGADWQLLAVVGFDDTTTVFRVDWRAGSMTEAGRLPAPVDGGVWLDEAGERLAVNLAGETGRSSVYRRRVRHQELLPPVRGVARQRGPHRPGRSGHRPGGGDHRRLRLPGRRRRRTEVRRRDPLHPGAARGRRGRRALRPPARRPHHGAPP